MAQLPILPQTRVLPLTRIQRERRLPVNGNILVNMGSRVNALDVIARSEAAGRLHPIPIARYMQSSEATLHKHLLKPPGAKVEAGEIIASKREFFGTLRRIYRAPGPGRIAAVQRTWMALELTDVPFELRALYRGSVVNVMPQVGVVIEATGALVQGVWGSGGEGCGPLKKVVDAPDAILTDEKIDVSARGAILLAGGGATENAIRSAVMEHAAGMIVGGLSPQVKDLVVTSGFPTLVTDGFGERAMAAPIFELLNAHVGEEATLNTTTRTRDGTVRPEVFVPVAPSAGAVTAAPPANLTTEVGARVRIIAAPQLGEIGKIVKIPKMPQTLESGISAWSAEIQLSTGPHVFVPWENLELIDG